ncbi:proprotein convertase subtilisin/kexin type 5-like isoform X1 [Polyodon spathula]|uniref:proprotein convertase subtilisin/kexin type 5-like isoform X1 n=1 Tax=Polyodon spathula TaxID=7913 RepID=UPI001B7F7623|nr:proprotein convertase subtilisin/kexin type 5-like isoform X1 [Polyodon spathula]
MGWKSHLNREFVCVLALWLVCVLPLCRTRMYTNHWAVRITGASEDADRIANKYGYSNMGQIGDLKDYYHFFHRRTIKRSTLSSRGTHNFISMEPEVEWIEQQVVKRRIKRDYKASPPQSMYFNDPKWTSMWYIHCNDNTHNCQSDMNIVGAWKRGYTGKNVVVTILDDGIERNHPDLIENYDSQASFDVNGNDYDPMPRYDASNENKHGTRCAGEVAASANNSHCTVGIAYNAKIGGVRMLDGDVTDMVEAKSLSLQPQHIDIYSASWGPDDDGKTVDGPASLARQAFENGIRLGRKGRGSIFVWASGNGGRSRDHCSCDGYTNSIYTISISSTAESGKKPWYLEECSSTLTTTYSSGESYDRKIITTDLRQRCTDSHTGTSASAPMAAGIIALALEANPFLTWRDVQHIIVRTSRAGHLSAPDWKTNAAGYKVSHLYGFGLMDAEAMVQEAERWKAVPTQHICVESADRQIRTIRPENVVRSVYKAPGCADNSNHHVIYLEHVVVRITITHHRRGDLSIYLTSPSGTKSQLLANRLFDHSMEGFKNWEFMTTHCWGEKAAGDWILEIYDTPSQLRNHKTPGKLKEWSLVLYGTSVHPYSPRFAHPKVEKPRSPVETTTPDYSEYTGPCDPECSDGGCDGPGPHQCIDCLHYFLKFKNHTRTCVSECPSGFFRDDKKRCKKCYSLCDTCVGSRSDQCTSCKPGYHLNEETYSCVSSCPESFYLDKESNMCRKCSEHCKKCTGLQTCTECRPGMSLQGSKCSISCDAGTYYNAHRKECEICHKACAACAGTGAEACTKCAEDYYMEDWRCVLSCSAGYYLEQSSENAEKLSTCRKCDASCLTCTGSGEKNCTSCISGYNLESGICVVGTICKDGEYIDDSGKCHLCDATCYKCTGPDKNQCLSCTPTRYFDDGHCIIACSKGKFQLNGQCHLCHHTCKQCSGGEPYNCTACDKDKFGNNRYLFQGECKEACPRGYYPSAEKICQQCPDNCEVCERANECLKCSSDYYPSNGKCIKLNCEEGEVEDPEYEECMECEKGCKKCLLSDPRSCFSCKDGFYMFKTRCFERCPEKTYNDDKTMECRECHKNCVSCDENQCYWCEEGWFFSENECVETCDAGFYGDEESQECQPCHQTCKTCAGPNFDDCESCPDDQELVNGKCGDLIKSCPIGSFWSASRKCEKCDRFCKTCTTEQTCTSCKTGRYLTAHQSCVTTCPEKTFANTENGKCEGCAEGCAQCSKKNNCQKCLNIPKHALYLHEGKCLSKCPSGYFEDVETCTKCSPECKTCKDDFTSCQACHQHYVLYQNRCMTTCPDEYFSEDGHCKRCTPDCKKCDEQGICRECNNHFFLHLQVCVDKCPVNFYEDARSQTCSRCHSDCAECDGPDPDDCVSCADSRAALYRGQCFQECPDNTYHDIDTGDCQDCDRTCQTCKGSSSTDCITCIEGMVKNKQGHCVTHWDCPLSSYQDKRGACRHCHKSCHLCTGPTHHECLSCTESHYLLNSTCLDQCPDGYYKDEDGWRCVPCHSSCGTCSGQYECSRSCDTGYYFSASIEDCLRCDPSCKVCVGSERTDCVTCQRNYFFLRAEGRCYFSCPEGYYKNSEEHTCVRCHPTCKTCKEKGALKCESCHFGFDNLNGICVSKCLTGEYAVAEDPEVVCKPCDDSCIECKGSGPNNCTDCPASTLITPEGRCLHCCDSLLPQSVDCCNCTETREECIVQSHFILQQMDYTDKPALFIISSILMILALGGGIFFFLRSRSKGQPKEKSGYEKLANSSKPISSFDPKRASGGSSSYRKEHGIEYSDRVEKEEEEEEDEDEDIVYMGQDGTVYRKFKYGLMEDDDDEELEYDDESYSFK